MVLMLQLQILLQGPGLTEDLGTLISVSLMELLSQHTLQTHLGIRGEGISSMLGSSLDPPQCVWSRAAVGFMLCSPLLVDESLFPGD